jgi:hypothetical protein
MGRILGWRKLCGSIRGSHVSVMRALSYFWIRSLLLQDLGNMKMQPYIGFTERQEPRSLQRDLGRLSRPRFYDNSVALCRYRDLCDTDGLVSLSDRLYAMQICIK